MPIPQNFDESKAPEAVRLCLSRGRRLKVELILSRNPKVLGCEDAAHNRFRLGRVGIPLRDELKSLLVQYRLPFRGWITVLTHCRADRELSFEKIKRLFWFAQETRLAPPKVSEEMGMSYGTVNPILAHPSIPQVFDLELQRKFGTPGTVMTNAGHHQWAIEFTPAELVVKLANSRWADIVEGQASLATKWGPREPEIIGILTGNPGDSGRRIWAGVESCVQKLLGDYCLGDVSMPRFVVESVPEIGMSLDMVRRENALRKALWQGVDELCRKGARIICHPAHTTHYFVPEMTEWAKSHGAEFVSMAEATGKKLEELNITEAVLLGTKFVTDLRQKWSPYREPLKGIKVIPPTEKEWERIIDLANEVQASGPGPVSLNVMRDLLSHTRHAHCPNIVLAMTEFKPVTDKFTLKQMRGKNLIDPMDIYADAIAKRWLRIID